MNWYEFICVESTIILLFIGFMVYAYISNKELNFNIEKERKKKK